MQIQEITGGMLPTNCFIVTDEALFQMSCLTE